MHAPLFLLKPDFTKKNYLKNTLHWLNNNKKLCFIPVNHHCARHNQSARYNHIQNKKLKSDGELMYFFTHAFLYHRPRWIIIISGAFTMKIITKYLNYYYLYCSLWLVSPVPLFQPAFLALPTNHWVNTIWQNLPKYNLDSLPEK